MDLIKIITEYIGWGPLSIVIILLYMTVVTTKKGTRFVVGIEDTNKKIVEMAVKFDKAQEDMANRFEEMKRESDQKHEHHYNSEREIRQELGVLQGRIEASVR